MKIVKMILTKLNSGLNIFAEDNKAGGLSYYGESCGEKSLLWDSCIGTEEEFMFIAKHCYGLNLIKENTK